jgi:hypothetical protein
MRLIAGMLLFVGIFVLVTEPARLARVRESARIQRGPSVVARVGAVKVREVGIKHPHHDTDYFVSFTDPRNGRTSEAKVTRTFVNDARGVDRSLRVSFDPQNPSHAEVTDHPANTMGDWWFILCIASGFTAVGVAGVFLLRR